VTVRVPIDLDTATDANVNAEAFVGSSVPSRRGVNLRTRVTRDPRLTPFFAPCLRVEQSLDAQAFGKLRAFSFVRRKNMPHADARTQNAQYLDVADDQSAARELQKVLSLRLPSFYRCALRLLGNRTDAEDAVQEALLAAHKHLHQFRGQSQMSTWLTTIVSNCARMQLRKRPRQIQVPLYDHIGEGQKYSVFERLADPRPNPEDACRNSELTAHLRKCAALLSPSLRRTFQLRVVDGLSIFETAQVLGLPHGTVKAQLARARTKLARYMQRALEPRWHTPQRRARYRTKVSG
jgi:RNA polymerase sigma-70 factor, ECF subfamily